MEKDNFALFVIRSFEDDNDILIFLDDLYNEMELIEDLEKELKYFFLLFKFILILKKKF